MRRSLLVLLASSVLSLGFVAPASAAGVNDAYADATPLAIGGAAVVSNPVGATVEAGEEPCYPIVAPGTGTVWHTVTAPADGWLLVDARPYGLVQDIATSPFVWVGFFEGSDVATATEVGCDFVRWSYGKQAAAPARRGHTYHVAISTADPESAQPMAVSADFAPQPFLSVEDVTVAEPKGKQVAVAELVLTLSEPADQPIELSWFTYRGTTREDEDFHYVESVVTFPAGATRQVVPVSVLPDRSLEGTESFEVVIADGCYVHVFCDDEESTSAAVTITDSRG